MGMSSHDYEVKTDKTGDRYTCKRKNYRYIIYLFLSHTHTYRFVICLRMSSQGERESCLVASHLLQEVAPPFVNLLKRLNDSTCT